MGGSAVVGSALNREVLKSVWDKTAPPSQMHRRSIILLSGLVGGVLALWLLKSFKLAGIVLGVSYYTTLLSTAQYGMHKSTAEVVQQNLATIGINVELNLPDWATPDAVSQPVKEPYCVHYMRYEAEGQGHPSRELLDHDSCFQTFQVGETDTGTGASPQVSPCYACRNTRTVRISDQL